jgi:hypothetical protein
LPILVAARLVLSESTVPSATIVVPAAGVAVSPSEYVVAELVWIVRWKPSRSVIVIVPPEADTTVPARCGVRSFGAGAEPDADGLADADGVAGAEDADAWATATPPTARTAAETPAMANRRPVRDRGPGPASWSGPVPYAGPGPGT